MSRKSTKKEFPPSMERYVVDALELPTDLATAAWKKVREHYVVCEKLCPDPLEDIFIDTVVEADGGGVRCLDLTFFSQRYFVSAADFLRADDYVVDFVARGGHGYRMQSEGYRLGDKPSQASRLYVELLIAGVMSDQARWIFRAARANCTQLAAIMLKYVKVNLKAE